MTIESKLPWPWLVLGVNDALTSFTTLCNAPTQDAAIAFARATGHAGRACMVVRVGDLYPGTAAINVNLAGRNPATGRLSATVARLRTAGEIKARGQ